MPTEFTRATEYLSELEAIVKSYTNSSNDVASIDYDMFDELNTSLTHSLGNFIKRIDNGTYNGNMAIKVNDLIRRHQLLGVTINTIKDERRHNQMLINTESNKKIKSEENSINDTETKNVNVEVEETQSSDGQSASSSLPPSSLVEETQSSDGQSASSSLPPSSLSPSSLPPQPPQSSPLTSDDCVRRSLSETYARKLIESIFRALEISIESELSREQVKEIITTILVAKMNGGSHDHNVGWKRWFDIETEAAFLLMDADNSGFISSQELIMFASQHPQMFGPILHIERLFRSFDTNNDGYIDSDELYVLLLEVELEISTEEPNLDTIQYKTLQYMSDYDLNRDHRLSLLEFTRLVFAHHELLGNACMMRIFFKEADKNNDDKLDRQEIHDMMLKFLKTSALPIPSDFSEMAAHILTDADTDKDGFVSFTEFMDYFVRNPNRIELFDILLNFSKALNPFEDSFYKDLCRVKSNALGHTDHKKPEIDFCANCSCPLVGLKMGVTKFGRSFCNSSCSSSFDGASEEKANYLSKFSKANFRAVTHDDYDQAGNNSWKYFRRGRRW